MNIRLQRVVGGTLYIATLPEGVTSAILPGPPTREITRVLELQDERDALKYPATPRFPLQEYEESESRYEARCEALYPGYKETVATLQRRERDIEAEIAMLMDGDVPLVYRSELLAAYVKLHSAEEVWEEEEDNLRMTMSMKEIEPLNTRLAGIRKEIAEIRARATAPRNNGMEMI